VTGYYGKVSTHGDFVGRGLPPQLVQAWDGWLQECMRASQAALGPAWLERYLNGPVWRFAIAPGVLGLEGLGGIMMPSVDRVGRYFPLMVGALGAAPLLDWFETQAAWYDAVEDLARTSLDSTFLLARFEALPLPSVALAGVRLDGQTMWWTEGGPFVDPSMMMCSGMPGVDKFAAMLDADSPT